MKRTSATIKALTLLLLVSFHSLSKAETIQIASGEYPPWTSQSLPGGGYINRLVSEAFKLHNIDVKFDYLPWKRALEATRIGNYHATSFWGESEERRQDFLHSQTIENIYFVFFYTKKRFNGPFKWQSLDELGRLKIGATRSYTYNDEFWRLYKQDRLRVSISNTDIDNLRKLISGTIDLFPISEFTGKYLLHRNFSPAEIESIGINTKALSEGKNYILFSKTQPDSQYYLNILNAGLEALRQEGKFRIFQEEMFK
ncbi:hypothetical protein A3752_00045 [Oleiphilus sp. HI0081]|jgi:polar amino acid transport system substrate-binding protein|uniref:substrate-binding periplasmic protein n=2 Tax=Oleiphilus TaxID=141450 RepID=UPI0007C3BF91|nr:MULTISPECIES: transporter substrate-binding domain-containing protein [unclassified Oleiphilus]KZY75795.1 hypothetical protein A3741_11620 [Oleiphilus sp. HI0069]KZY76599.1 hypothetical protein A3740_12425 [Oleiphilus sp. HI0068]KZY88935.1 hypothetical protein A3743_09935 [Oleiphilus sp. HI0072]KZZ09872.1 hypothetical protein A3749_01620 [Oleiphilus sp. HI0078]KZZ22238.1 hypothetical protein A3752_00045 [Oleiphilus sp. HI0081]KZZ38520.1 hypothetical protein A3755_05095 [Oleiphilus sp. HI00